MCGRFTLHTEKELLERRFDIDLGERELVARYNVAPTEPVVVVRHEEDTRISEEMRWGLVPHWAKEPGDGPGLINARSETVATRPAFRDSFRKRRCLILADGFYEWAPPSTSGGAKRPHWIALASGEPFAMAGIWAKWRRPGDLFEESLPTLHSCAILTAPANSSVSPVHQRMPVILHPEAEAAWIEGPEDTDPEHLLRLLAPVSPDALGVRPVSRRVNSPRNQGPELIEAFDEDDPSYF